MDYPASIMPKGPGESSEHVARLVDLRRFGLLRRWDDLLDEGVAAVFGITGGETELVGLCFHAGKFTPHRVSDVACRARLQAPALRPELRQPRCRRF